MDPSTPVSLTSTYFIIADSIPVGSSRPVPRGAAPYDPDAGDAPVTMRSEGVLTWSAEPGQE